MARKTFSLPLTVVSIFVAASLTLGTPAREESNLCSGIDDEEFDHSTLLQLPLQQPQQSIKDVGNLCDEEFDQSTLLQLPQQQPKMTAGIKDSGALAGQHQHQSTARTWVLSGEVGGILAEFYYYTSTPPMPPGNFEGTPDLTRVDPSINYPHKNLLGKRNNFGIRFTGGLRIVTAGNYTLSLISDDGSILLLDDVEVVDNGGWHWMTKKSASVELAAGDHPLEVNYVQGTSGAGIILRYSGPDTGDAEWVVPSSALVTPAGVQLPPATTAATRLPSIGEVGGLLAEFFYDSPTSTVSIFDGDLSEQEPDVSRVDTAINYPKVSQAWTGLTTYKNFCAKWSGGLRIEVPGTYRLRIESDDGSVLIVNGTKVVDNDGYHGMSSKTSDVELVAGDHPIEVRYFSSTDGAGMIFWYAGPDTFDEFIVVPATALVAPEGVQPPTLDVGPPARHGLLNRRAAMRTDFMVPGTDGSTNHNECNFNTPDGRLFFCGEMSRYVRYFKFESLTYTANGMPIFNDSTWSLWPERLFVPNPNEASGCVADWKKPFEVLDDGSHFYSFFATTVKKRVQINVTVANPMTPQAEIVSLVQGNAISFTTSLPKYHYFTADGKMVVGDGGYSALPESGEPCSLDGWHPVRPLTSAYADADGLNLPERYPFARWRLYKPGGEPWPDQAGSDFGRYLWIDLDGRNLWFGRSGKWQVMGEDTYGMEYTIDGPLNLWGRTSVRFMSSTLWNFESERTTAHRFPGERHTSGVGSGCTYQLQMSKAHHVLPVFDAKSEFYTEVELVSVWKSPHWDIFFLPMVNAPYDGKILPDMSRHFLNGRRVGAGSELQWAMNEMPAGTPHGQGAVLWVKGDGGLFVDLSSATDVMGVTSSTQAFTAQLSFRSYSYSNNARPLLVHPDISLWYKGSMLTWTFKGESITGGGFVTHSRWHHVALVFDGVDQTVTTFNNGFEVTTVATGVTSFQLDKNFPVIFGHNVTQNLNKAVGHRGLIDNIRFMHHARAQKAICGDAAGSNCNDAVSHHVTTTQFSLSMQIKECTAATMHTLGCSSAIHRVCANLDAKKGQEANISNDRLLALTPPGPPVSMAGVPVSIGDETVAVACSPNTNHLSVPVDWWIMAKYESHCNHMSNHSSLALYCNLAAHGFCKDAFTDINSDSATGIIFEADARAWVSCFAADEVLSEDIANVPACNSDLTGIACQLEAAALCTAHDGGVPQALVDGTLLVHCFNAPPAMGLHNFTL